MIYNPMFIIGFIFLTALSVYDMLTYNKKKGFIPASLTSMFIVIALLLGAFFHTIQATLYLGALGVAIAYLLTDLDLWEGWADLKCFVASAILVPDVVTLLLFASAMTFFSVIIKYSAKSVKLKKIPFIPIIMIGYLAGWILKLVFFGAGG